MAYQRPNLLKEAAKEKGETPETLVPKAVKEHGSIAAAAVALGVSPTTIRYWLKKLKIKVETRRVTTFAEEVK